MSPRRSSRARNPHTQAVGATHSSTSSSNSSGRLNRATQRSDIRHTSLTPTSLSEDDMDRPEPGSRQRRQARRENPTPGNAEAESIPARNGDGDGDGEEEEITRCLCRRQEYPGPPIPLPETPRPVRESQPADSLPGSDPAVEEPGSLFIQCDVCKVWQHGGCVSIMNTKSAPENYFCEECRSDFHKIMVGPRGQRYSRYLPVYEAIQTESARKQSLTKDSGSRASWDIDYRNAPVGSAAYAAAKRRSTMNSRAMWEEEEELQRVLEASKTEGTPELTGRRKTKRVREDSDETKQDLKRRKTGSDSDSASNIPTESQVLNSDDEASRSRSSHNGALKKMRSGNVGWHRERDLADRDKNRERERAEAAGRRKGRAERRHADESESPGGNGSNARPIAVTRPIPSVSSRTSKPAPSVKGASTPTLQSAVTSHKKNSRPPNRRGRVGRNQYTKDRDNGIEGKPQDSPGGSRSREDDAVDGQTVLEQQQQPQHQQQAVGGMMGNGSRPAKPRHMNPNRTSMNDMRKRAAGVLEFISRTQVELAAEQAVTPPASSRATTATTAAPQPALMRVASVNASTKRGGMLGSEEMAAFKCKSSLQMMDLLTREIVLWQKEHGKWGER